MTNADLADEKKVFELLHVLVRKCRILKDHAAAKEMSKCAQQIIAALRRQPETALTAFIPGECSAEYTNAVALSRALLSGPDFNAEVNLHADTVAERHDNHTTAPDPDGNSLPERQPLSDRVLVPREPDEIWLRPFIMCPADELLLAWRHVLSMLGEAMTAEPTKTLVETPKFDELSKHERHDTRAETFYWCGQYAQFARQLERELSLAQARLAEVEKNAERYRWLRENGGIDHPDWPHAIREIQTGFGRGNELLSRASLDAAIDEAIRGSSH